MISEYSITDAKKKLAKIINTALTDHVPIKIHKDDEECVYIISEDDYNSIQETIYLLQNRSNSLHLSAAASSADYKHFESIQDLKNEIGL